MDKPTTGRIVETEIFRDGKSVDPLPAVIISSQSQIASEKLLAVGISSDLNLVPAADMVLLPYFPGGRCRTGLSKKCAAICDSAQRIKEENILFYRGEVDETELREIRERVIEVLRRKEKPK